jgi:competence protein ComEA
MHYFHVLIFTLLVALTGPASAGPVDINTADAAMLAAAIDGVGEKKAVTIVRHRETHGPFASVDGLAGVKGIGAATVQRNRSKLTVVPVTGQARVHQE